MDQYVAQGIAVLGVSADSQRSHKFFAQKYKLPFPLLADTEGTVIRAYDVASDGQAAHPRARRVTFLIDGSGKIEKIWDPVSAPVHNKEVLEFLSHQDHAVHQ
jgi:thioredoxin-dependent peroxiredoxin